MQYSPKLKKAMQQIAAIVQEHDIAGMIVLHTPGFSEYKMHIDTSYSVAKFEGDQLRVRAKLNEDYNGDKTAWNKDVTNTLNMLHLFGETGAGMSISFLELADTIGKKVNATHSQGGHSSNTEQNN